MFFFNDLTNHVISLVELHSSRPVGDAIAPTDPDNLTIADYPYSVVYPAETSYRLMSGPLTNSQGDKGLPYGIVYVALSREGCERLAERVRSAMVYDNFKDFPGVKILSVTIDEFGHADRTTEVRPPVFSIRDEFLIRTTES